MTRRDLPQRPSRRAVLRGLAGAAMTVHAPGIAWSATPPASLTVRTRRAVQDLSKKELAAYLAAWEKTIELGWLARLNAEHTRCLVHDQHEVMPRSDDLSVEFVSDHRNHHGHASEGAERFLPWHRLFLDTFETLLNRAYAQLTPAKKTWGAGELSVPYWDWSRGWLPEALWTWEIPKALASRALAVPPLPMHGNVPMGGWLPTAHPGRGGTAEDPKHVEYQVSVFRGEELFLLGSKFPRRSRIQNAIVASACGFTEVSARLEWRPYTHFARGAAARGSMAELETFRRGPVEPPAASGAVSTPTEMDALPAREALEIYNKRVGVPTAAAPEEPKTLTRARQERPEQLAAIPLGTRTGLPVQAGPHSAAHLFGARRGRPKGPAGPAAPDLPSPLAHYHEACFDPLFFMLHAQVDRIWWTRQRRFWDGGFRSEGVPELKETLRRLAPPDPRFSEKPMDTTKYPSYGSEFRETEFSAHDLAELYRGKDPYDKPWTR